MKNKLAFDNAKTVHKNDRKKKKKCNSDCFNKRIFTYDVE